MAAYNFESKGLVDAILTPIAVCEAVEMNESIVVPRYFALLIACGIQGRLIRLYLKR